MGKTIKQIADELGVSKQAIQKRISREPLYTKIQPYIDKVGGTMYIEYIGENLIKSAFLENDRQPVVDNQPTTHMDNVYSVLKATIDTLQEQLKVKDEQIAELIATNREQAQSINADRHLDLAEKFEESQEKKLISDRADKPKLKERLKYLFNR